MAPTPSYSRYKRGKQNGPRIRDLDGPMHDEAYIIQVHKVTPLPAMKTQQGGTKSTLSNFSMTATNGLPSYIHVEGRLPNGLRGFRTTVTINIDPPVQAVGDHANKKESERLAILSALYQLQELGVLDKPKKFNPALRERTSMVLPDGSEVTYERARSFMDYYCRRYKFGAPDMTFVPILKGSGWEAIMSVGERRIGLGSGKNKKAAQLTCYLDVTEYLYTCDPELWKAYIEAAKSGTDLGMAPRITCRMSEGLNDDIRDLCADIRKSNLYRNRPAVKPRRADEGPDQSRDADIALQRNLPTAPLTYLKAKSARLSAKREEYKASEHMAKMRATRESLPVYTRAEDVVRHVQDHDVTICMAATGSGKTTQIPQLILDDYIERGDGAKCNLFVTQPRRLAAISVADRVAKERGEALGETVGYQVRFEAKLPRDHGSITFCTTGIFLKRMQSAMQETQGGARSMDNVTHVVVDEVHERDVDTDLLLVVLKKLLADRKARNKPLKIILMSATIDATLFQEYFADNDGRHANIIEIPGRSFPVTKYFLDDFLPAIQKGPMSWVTRLEPVMKYLVKELGPQASAFGGHLGRVQISETDELDAPPQLIAAAIAHAMQVTEDGHVLVFLPGWEEITATQRALLEPQLASADFGNTSKYSVHLLHSSIPIAEQQVIFDPPGRGIRRIILATNIAETSVTIPDVVCVVDTAKVKEQRYDPERHMSSLVSAWIGSSNLNQRAGRAGRHRSGEYFGLLSKRHAETLQPYQTVEMKRVDLSNIVMHVKALDFPGMTVGEVLSATIEAPDPVRVESAIRNLQMVGALDADKSLTSLGRVLLQLPVDAQMGRLVLYGSFFRCLDQALTLAAILTNRDPFMSPIMLKQEAAAKKRSWSPDEFRSDPLATLCAYNAWWSMQSVGEYVSANRFASENFLAKATLLMIQKVKKQLLECLYKAGVIDVSAGGFLQGSNLTYTPKELNTNGNSMPLLAGLIAIASQPKFAMRVSDRMYRTAKDKGTFMHPGSVNNRKHRDPTESDAEGGEKELYAFTEKRRNTTAGPNPQTFLVTTTRLDPMTYMLFGGYNLEVTERGLICDGWLPIVGNLDALDDIQRLKTLMEGSMLRVFEGITMGRRLRRETRNMPVLPRQEESESGDEDEDDRRDYALSREEVRELDWMTRDVVSILNRYSEERIGSQSRASSRPGTPTGSPMWAPTMPSNRLPSGVRSGYSTPSVHHSRPGTPSHLARRLLR